MADRWTLTQGQHTHAVTIADDGFRRRITWSVDGTEVATKATTDERVRLDGGDHGSLFIRLPSFIGPARRVTWHPVGATASALAGLGGDDFAPEPGSRAARRDERIRRHPRQYAAQQAVLATIKVLAPLLVAWLLARIAWPSIPLPDIDLPRIPWPDVDLPRIPWPDIDLPRFRPPEWLRPLLDALKYVGPVVIAVALAVNETRRRRRRVEEENRRRAANDAQQP